ncbi:MAG TPA: phosphohistidine phosphatase SixA [Gemmatimonadales bacterium]|nr:phosphohistidine phosphatase SixA [Gemmatimonadales bacterium]
MAPLRLLYLVQHGEAKPETEDPARPLTERGRGDVESVARAAARAEVRLARVAHSGKLRARETAEIIAAALSPPRGVVQLAGLAPMDDPAIAQRAVAELTEPTMLVGHLPHLSRLASLLLVGDPARDIVAFRMGGIVCLGNDEGRWRVGWMLTPELVP